MKDGLPLKLFEYIKAQGYITYQQMVDKTNDLGYKVETATRKLRLLTDETDENPNPLVKKVKNDKGVIIGYRMFYIFFIAFSYFVKFFFVNSFFICISHKLNSFF